MQSRREADNQCAIGYTPDRITAPTIVELVGGGAGLGGIIGAIAGGGKGVAGRSIEAV
jgi:hypothetical protein